MSWLSDRSSSLFLFLFFCRSLSVAYGRSLHDQSDQIGQFRRQIYEVKMDQSGHPVHDVSRRLKSGKWNEEEERGAPECHINEATGTMLP